MKATATVCRSASLDDIVVSDHKILINFGQSCYDNKPKPIVLTMTELARRFAIADTGRGTLSLAEYLALDKSVPEQKVLRDREKNGAYFIPAEFKKPGTRRASDVKATVAFSGDIDKGNLTKEYIQSKLAGLEYIAYSSYSHHPEDRRWRFLVRYAKATSAASHKKVYAYFQQMFDGLLDSRSETVNQLWYTPACPNDALDLFEFFFEAGNPLDVDALPTVAVSQPAPPLAAATISTAQSQLQASTTDPSDLFLPRCDGSRTEALCRLAGFYVAHGLTEQQVVRSCMLWNASNTPPLDAGKVVATCRSIVAAEARNHPTRGMPNPALASEPLFDLAAARIDHFLTTPPPQRRWILDGVLPLGIVGAIVSPGGSGKSQLLMQLGYSVATGIPLACHWKVGEQGAVLMLCAEDDQDEIHRRVHRINTQLGSGLSAAEKKQLTDRLFIRSMVGEELPMTIVGNSGEAIRTALAERLALTAKQVADIKLIVIDPASRFRGGDENSNQHATRFVQAIEYLAQESGATVLIAHHTNKASTYGDEATAQSARGASALSDGIRLQIALTPLAKTNKLATGMPEDERRRHLEVAIVKTNYTAPQAPVLLRREDDGYLKAAAGSSSSNSPRQLLLFALLRIIFKPPFTLTARQIELTMCGPGKPLQISQREARKLIKEARDDGLIWNHKGHLMVTAAGRDLLAANGAAVDAAAGAAGTARRCRAPRKTSTNSTT